ncbi:phage/plasmid primase, P4 family [Streptomyces albidoflavus]|uniref:phage/plasmid primase, P4 family n=1 Tax=Streptomyces albidoflavus TaxID=1886 RepID=UPI00386D7F5D|nr:phage/plasmid primase, P4 family [Streptomyces albidoflavus]
MKMTEILERFERVTEQEDGGYLALCAAHGDTVPSLRLWLGEDGKARLACRAGCDNTDVIKAAGLRWEDMFNVSAEGSATVAAERPSAVGVGQTAALGAFVEAAYDNLSPDSEAAAYAERRFGVTPDMFRELSLGFSAEGGDYPLVWLSRSFTAFPRLTVPLFDFNGVPCGLQGRDITGDCPLRWVSLKNPDGMRWAPYGYYQGDGGYGVTLITEGPGDGLTAVAVGYDVVMVRGASLVTSPETLAEIAAGVRGTQVIACGDNDASGREFNRKLTEGLAAHGVPVYSLPIPAELGAKADLSDWREADPVRFPSLLHNAVRAAKGPAMAAVAAPTLDIERRTGAEAVTTEDGIEAAKILGELIKQYDESDVANAHALVAWTNGDIRYCPELGWYVWDGHHWRNDRTGTAVRQRIHAMAGALGVAGKMREARGFNRTQGIDNLMRELKAVPSVFVESSELDANPELLACRNGTVDLRTGRLRPSRKEDLITTCLDINYDPDAECPRWERFITEIMPGMPEMPGYLQRLTGYGITGYTDEQCFCVFWGKGKNGKSVFTDTLTYVFREITKTTAFATFEVKPSGGIPNDIAALRGARLVMASEGESGTPMSEAVLKRVSGKDMISARFLQKEFFEFRPRFLLMLATNHKPKFKGQDEGLWRRVKMVPFTRWFAPHERDMTIDRQLQAEAEGILAWAVRGSMAWMSGGLQDPESVVAATKAYKETSDVLAGFFPDVIELRAGARMLGSDAYNRYREWCEAEGLPAKEVWSRKIFYSALEERGVTRVRVSKGMALEGVRLADQGPAETGPGIFSKD